jgi:DnaJ-domain-containing protein 1
MTDFFALLGETRRPWLDTDVLKARFLQLSTHAHPDRFHNASETEKAQAGQRYAELNTAFQCLNDPKERLGHLLELELGASPRNVQRIPPGTMDLFMEVGQLCRDADAFLAERSKVTSPLLKVQFFQRAMQWTDSLNALQQKVNGKREELVAELLVMNAAWASAPPVGSAERAAALPLERLEQVYRSLSYASRWTEQVQEELVRLAI